MSLYSDGSLTTKILDPLTDLKNYKFEFRLGDEDATFLPSMKLVDLGQFGVGGSTYNRVAGIAGMIKSIFLYDGKVELDSVRSCNRHLAFKNLRDSNSVNRDVNKVIVKNKLGYRLVGSVNHDQAITEGNVDAGVIAAADSQDGVYKGALNLKDVLPLLGVIKVLPSSVFKKLRLVVELETFQRNITTSQANVLTNCRPALIVDMASDRETQAKMLSSFGSVVYNAIEHDQILVPAVANGISTTTNKKVMGFNNKRVMRLLITPNFTDASKNLNGNDIIASGHYNAIESNEVVYQINVNEEGDYLPRDGQKGNMRRLALLNDVYGRINILPGENAATATSGITLDDLRGHQDRFGLFLDKYIRSLKISHTRVGKNDANNPSLYNDAITLFIEAEVSKSLLVQGGSYMIQYNN